MRWTRRKKKKSNEISSFYSKEIGEGCDVMRSACGVQGLQDPGASHSDTFESSPTCRVCELLQGGAVMNKVYQPHEGHVPYLLQLFIDFNLYGMNLLNLAAVRFRRSSRAGERASANWM